MNFKFDNFAKQVSTKGKYHWYEWQVFMDEPQDTLEKVKQVEYRLHKTFPNPIRVIDNRQDNFALKSAGWGEFTIFITIYLIDGTEAHKEYYLDLGKNWPTDQ